MGNKLRDIFKTEDSVFKGTFSFADNDAYKRFIEGMRKVQEEGGSVHVGNGVSIDSYLTNGKSESEKYNRHEGEIQDLSIFAEKKPFSIDVEINHQKREVKCQCTRVDSGLIIFAPEKSVIDFKIRYNHDKKTLNLSVTPRLENAKSSEDVIDGYKIVETVFKRFVSYDTDSLDVSLKKEHQEQIASLFKRIAQEKRIFEVIYLIEQKLNLKFDITKFAQDPEYLKDVEEMYFVLFKKFPIRLNAKVNSSDTKGINIIQADKDIEIGSSINITFGSDIIFNICGTEIKLFTANIICNAFVKEVLQQKDGHTKIIFGDNDVCPMFISYRVYMTEEEALNEANSMMQHKEEYMNAKTVYEYLAVYGLN